MCRSTCKSWWLPSCRALVRRPIPKRQKPLRWIREVFIASLPVWSPIRKLSRNGLMGKAEVGFRVRTKVNSLWPNPELVIALHSPSALLETGLHLCPTEKDLDIASFDPKQSVLCSPVCLRLIAKYRSEERRVGKECRSRGHAHHQK